MKTYQVIKTGNVPSFVSSTFDAFNGREVNTKTRAVLEESVREHVTEFQDAHGNTSIEGASLWHRDGEQWELNIKIK